jgi:hypothetical protein
MIPIKLQSSRELFGDTPDSSEGPLDPEKFGTPQKEELPRKGE